MCKSQTYMCGNMWVCLFCVQRLTAFADIEDISTILRSMSAWMSTQNPNSALTLPKICSKSLLFHMIIDPRVSKGR